MRFDFKNKEGHILSGRLEMPSSKPRAIALFAHCFTCSKDIIAPNVISKTLIESGIAVLRFDFTGLGNSQGDFSNTNFSSNVEDLVSACSELSAKVMAPKILIGHSLGGAAVLRAAQKLNNVKAVVTIGAPSSTDHVKHLFQQDLEKIKEKGEAKVNLAGREFTIKKQFIDDISELNILEGVKTFKKALLVMHAPLDDTVGIEHASKIFTAAKHPKSFISLDESGHLLMNRRDAAYAGQVISAWVGRYISPAQEQKMSVKDKEVVVVSRDGSKFTHDIWTKDHHLVSDEPLSIGGDHLGLNPYELVLAGLGSCTSMTMKMYAEHKGIPLEKVRVSLKHEKIHPKDCAECETASGKIDRIEKEIFIEGDLTDEQKTKLLEIAEKCPVNRTLKSEINIMSKLGK